MTRDNIFDKMGLRQIDEDQQLLFYSTLTAEEKARMHPCTKATCVMMSGDSPGLDSRSTPTSYDLPDDARPGELPPVIPISSKLNHSNHDNDNDTIEEVTTIVKKRLPSPEPRPQVYHKNGIDSDNNNKSKLENKFAENNKEDNDACVNCLYYTQQFCECVIL